MELIPSYNKELNILPTVTEFLLKWVRLQHLCLIIIFDILMTLALLQELLMALRANAADGYKSCLALGIEELRRDVSGGVESDLMLPLLVEVERDRLMAWQLGMSI